MTISASVLSPARLPRQAHQAGAIEDPHSDAIAYLWQTGQGKPGATIFVGKQAK
jgi:hypothetical protein